jgi:hypothetical protein
MEHQSFAINTARSTRTWKIGGFPGGGVFLDRVAFAELSVFVAAAVHDVPKVATVEVPNATDTMEKSQSNIDKIPSEENFRGKLPRKTEKKEKKEKKRKKLPVPGVPVLASAGALVGAGTMVVAIVRARFGLAPWTGPPTGAHAGLIGALTT